jgi:predicted HD phosphohydrolase
MRLANLTVVLLLCDTSRESLIERGIMAPAPPGLSIVHTYRHLYRALLHAVQFSKPARYVVRNRLRAAFRRKNQAQLDPQRISKTLEFLRGAAREKGLEHRILKNLVHTAYMRAESLKRHGSRQSKTREKIADKPY